MELRLVDFNYTQQSQTGIAGSTESSEFPAENLRSVFRSKVWRPNAAGTFKIVASSNDRIDFKDSGGGSELHASLTAGTYTSTTLAAHIKTQMQAVGGGTYTISYAPGTGKWTIATSLGYLSVLWLTGVNTARSLAGTIGFSALADSTGATSYTGPNIALHTEESIVFDLGTTEAIDSFALLFDPITGPQLSGEAVVRIQGNATNVWTAPSVDVLLSLDEDFDIITYFWSSQQSYRYWRIKIVDPANTDLYIELGGAVLGLATQLSRLPLTGFGFKIIDQSKYSETEYGHRYGDVYPIRKKLEIAYKALTYADIKTLQTIFQRVSMGVPILVALDATGSFYDKDHFTLYAYFGEGLGLKNLLPGIFDQGVSFQEAF